MEGIVDLSIDIRDYLSNINDNITDIKIECKDMNTTLRKINGKGLYDLEDVYDKLADIESSVDSIIYVGEE